MNLMKNNKTKFEIPESIRSLSREQLERFCYDLFHHDHVQTHRANDLEEKILRAVIYLNSLRTWHEYDDDTCCVDGNFKEDLLEILEIEGP